MTRDEQAAKLYLKLWVLEEEDDESRVDEILEVQKDLKELGYPSDPVFDNDSEPLIKWEDPNFNYLKWMDEDMEDWDK